MAGAEAGAEGAEDDRLRRRAHECQRAALAMIRDRAWRGRRCTAFTLQWHLTNACPYDCRHCYDRSDRTELGLTKALGVVADLQAFCRRRRVTPRISLTGGDPFLYTHFWPLYEAIARAGIAVSILGNPVAAPLLQRLLAIQQPLHYQVSLEGLREHNDAIRGAGHFDRTFAFLAMARGLGLETHVMLTLTRANMAEVIPLGEALRGWTARFTFNRLAQVGNGASLELPSPGEFAAFLEEYAAARRANPVLGFKDNLFNVLRRRRRQPPLPGCTGHGCGAAFNFVALLPDGEVHACRKYPSPIGSIGEAELGAIYDSPAARRYRRGPEACGRCSLRRACRGCPAVAYGQGLDPLRDRDPFCLE